MRELSFSKLWLKLAQPRLTTFRFTRRDKDWQVGETVKVLYKARSPKDRSVLGQAVIVAKVPRWVCPVCVKVSTVIEYGPPNTKNYGRPFEGIYFTSLYEAQADGFPGKAEMWEYLEKAYGNRYKTEPMNKLTLAWTQYWLWVPEQKPLVAAQWAALMAKDWPQVIDKRNSGQYIIHSDALERIHDQAALGSMIL